VPATTYERIITICRLFKQSSLKDMKAAAGKKLTKDPDIKIYKLGFILDLLESEANGLLQSIIEQKMSLKEATKKAAEIKALHGLQDEFCNQTSTVSWTEAEQKYVL